MPDGTVYEQVISECEGSANSKEKRYRNQDVYTIVNTLQKMAIKRAMVGQRYKPQDKRHVYTGLGGLWRRVATTTETTTANPQAGG